MNIAVFASGTGSNFSAIAQAVKRKKLACGLKLLVCDNPKAKVIDKARRAKVEVLIVDREKFPSKREFEAVIISRLKKDAIDLIVLAGFMRILSPEFVEAFKGRIINIHPSLLPSFKGSNGIHDAYDYGAKVTGVTVHFVDEHMDHGPIILQKAIPIKENDTPESLEKRIHALEHKLYPQAIRLFLEGKLEVRGRKTVTS
ncbi:MAG: phosphoribosylglycinamide formyltransferase [Candidatus Omnitrophica bacterium]|nr:phosphoribosylglycinamide formyltransferase [Candidatus Omnitrophota bacterium]